MNVSFNGFKNAGVQIYEMRDIANRPQIRLTVFNCELTNDALGKDLDNFSSILRKYYNRVNKNFLNLSLLQSTNLNDKKIDSVFSINNHKCPVNFENLRTFEKITELLKRIAKYPSYVFKLNKDYIEGPDCIASFVFPDHDTSSEALNIMHEPENVKDIAKYIVETITDEVDSYLS